MFHRIDGRKPCLVPSALQFGYGGYQEARGSGISQGKNHCKK